MLSRQQIAVQYRNLQNPDTDIENALRPLSREMLEALSTRVIEDVLQVSGNRNNDILVQIALKLKKESISILPNIFYRVFLASEGSNDNVYGYEGEIALSMAFSLFTNFARFFEALSRDREYDHFSVDTGDSTVLSQLCEISSRSFLCWYGCSFSGEMWASICTPSYADRRPTTFRDLTIRLNALKYRRFGAEEIPPTAWGVPIIGSNYQEILARAIAQVPNDWEAKTRIYMPDDSDTEDATSSDSSDSFDDALQMTVNDIGQQQNALARIPGVGVLQDYRNFTDALLAGEDVSRDKARLIANVYDLSLGPRFRIEKLRTAVEEAQSKATVGCSNLDDLITQEPLADVVPAPFIARLPMDDGSQLCVNIADLVQFHRLTNPITRKEFDEETIKALTDQVRTLVSKLPVMID